MCSVRKERAQGVDFLAVCAARKKLQQSSDRVHGSLRRYTAGKASLRLTELMEEGITAPAADFFGPEYTVEKVAAPVMDNGFDDTVRYSHDQVVTGVKPGSNAEKAGLRNGDVILKASSEWEAVDDENMHLVYQVRRGETELTIEFLPRGEKVPCWQYVKC